MQYLQHNSICRFILDVTLIGQTKRTFCHVDMLQKIAPRALIIGRTFMQ